jgi:D-3-phosphoglycerate dehydrogenase
LRYKVVLTDHVYPDLELEKKLLAEAQAELVFIDTKEEDAIADAVRDVDAVITCYANITARAIDGMAKCKSISKTGIGVNNIDIEAATRRGIRVLNVPDYCIEEVSDTTIALALSLTRGIPFLMHNVKNGNWSLSGCENMSRLNGKVFSLMGFGRIARRTAEKTAPFGVQILAYDPYVEASDMEKAGVRKAELEELLSKADILSLNLPLTSETEGIINKHTLSLMKNTAILINTARGPLVKEEDLCQALKEGSLAGAGLDVICDEKYDINNPLFSLPNVIITPHSAFYSIESTGELRQKVLADVLAVLSGAEPKYQVNRFSSN